MKDKLSIPIQVLDGFSKPYAAFSQKHRQLVGELQDQRKEFGRLKSVSRSIDTYGKLKSKVSEASRALELAEDKQRRLSGEVKSSAVVHQQLVAAYGSASSEQQRLSQKVRETEQPTKQLSLALKDAERNQRRLAGEVKRSEALNRRLANAYERSRGEVIRLEVAHGRQVGSLKKVESSLERAKVDVNNFAAEQKRLELATNSANKSLTRQESRLKELSVAEQRANSSKARRSELRGQLLESVVMAGSVAYPVKLAVDYESAMADVRKSLNGVSPEQLKEIEHRILREAAELGVSNVGLANIIAEAGRNGIDYDNLFDFAGMSAKMSVAYGMSEADSAKSMLKWRNTMGLSQKEANRLADAVNYVGDNLATNAKDISEVLVRVGSVATGSGLRSEQSAALAGVVLSGSPSEEIAATATKNLLLALTVGSSATRGQKQAFSRLGFDSEDLAKQMQDNSLLTVETVLKAVKELEGHEQTAVMTKIFGRESIGAIAPLLENLSNFRKGMKLVEKDTNFSGSMQREFEIQSETTRRQLQRFNTSMSALGIAVGTTLLPGVNAVLDPLAKGAVLLASWASEHETATTVITGAIAAVVGLKVATVAAKLAMQPFSSLLNKSKLSRAKLNASTRQTEKQSYKTSTALSRLNAVLRRTASIAGSAGGSGGDYGGKDRKDRKGQKAGSKRSRFSPGGKFSSVLGGLSAGSAAYLASDLFFSSPLTNVDAQAVSITAKAAPGVLGVGSVPGSLSSHAPTAVTAGVLGAPAVAASNAASASSVLSSGSGLSVSSVTDVGADASRVAQGATDIASATYHTADSVGKVFRPLGIALDGVRLADAVIDGDAEGIGESAGSIAGGAGGAYAGMAIGSMIAPGIGTIIGGVIGALGGGELGEWIGGSLGSLFEDGPSDRLSSPEEVKKEIVSHQSSVKKVNQVKVDVNVPPPGAGMDSVSYGMAVGNSVGSAIVSQFPSVDLNTSLNSSLSDGIDS